MRYVSFPHCTAIFQVSLGTGEKVALQAANEVLSRGVHTVASIPALTPLKRG